MITCIGKVGETIILDDKICMTLIGIKDNQVLLHFEALDKVCIHRRKPKKYGQIIPFIKKPKAT